MNDNKPDAFDKFVATPEGKAWADTMVRTWAAVHAEARKTGHATLDGVDRFRRLQEAKQEAVFTKLAREEWAAKHAPAAPEVKVKVPQLEGLVKSVNPAAGTFTGLLAVFGNVDTQGDIVDPGAFTASIQDLEARRKANGSPYLLPVLWQHDTAQPIGGYTKLQETPQGLYVEGVIDPGTPEGQRAYSAVTKRYVDGLSIGYQVVKQQYRAGANHLVQVNLREGSVVTFPANPLARIRTVA